MLIGRKIYTKEYLETEGLTRQKLRTRMDKGIIPQYDGVDDETKINSAKFWFESTLYPERFTNYVEKKSDEEVADDAQDTEQQDDVREESPDIAFLENEDSSPAYFETDENGVQIGEGGEGPAALDEDVAEQFLVGKETVDHYGDDVQPTNAEIPTNGCPHDPMRGF